jgi:hypothetical protein
MRKAALSVCAAVALLTTAWPARAITRAPALPPAPCGMSSHVVPVVVMFSFGVLRHRALDTLFELLNAPSGPQSVPANPMASTRRAGEAQPACPGPE